MLLVWLLLVGLVGLTPSPVTAQSPALSTITTDTGAFAPGHRDFARYTTPRFCLAATLTARDVARRGLETQAILDTLDDVQQDTFGLAATTAVARACGARFTIANAAPSELPTLFAMALLLHNDTLAQQVLARQVALAPVAKRDSLQLGALAAFLGIDHLPQPRPALLTAAHALSEVLARDSSALDRLQLQQLLLIYWETRDNLSAIRDAAAALLEIIQQTPAGVLPQTVISRSQRNAFSALMGIAFLTQPDSMLPLATRVQQTTTPVLKNFRLVPANQLSVPQVLDALSPVGANWNSRQRHVMPRLQANAWYPAGADTLQPAPETVTLFVHGGNAAVANRVRRWIARYGPRGFRVTIVESIDDTAARWWVPGDYDLVNGPLTFTQRAARAKWYYLDYEHLPVTVAVQEKHVQFPAWPNDKRIVVTPSPFQQLLKESEGESEIGNAVLVARDGTILYTGNILTPGIKGELKTIHLDRLFAWAVAQGKGTPQTVTLPMTGRTAAAGVRAPTALQVSR